MRPWTTTAARSTNTTSCLMEPWDGPAAIAFTDGIQIGGVLDRNGLRPSRYYVTKDGFVVVASEAGVLPIPNEEIAEKGRVQPGKMFLVDTAQGRIIPDEEIKKEICTARPYRQWLDEHLVHLSDLPEAPKVEQPDHAMLLQRQIAFGYTNEDERIILLPMAKDGVEATGSMAQRLPLAVLSNKPRLLYDYFKQLFAQVTNPPIDSYSRREITSPRPRLVSAPKAICSTRSRGCVPPRRVRIPDPYQRGVAKIRAPYLAAQDRSPSDPLRLPAARRDERSRWKNSA